MRSRRAVLTASAIAVVGAVIATGRGDDVLRVLGVKPVPEVRDSDRELIAAARTESEGLLADALARRDDRSASVLTTQLAALSSTDVAVPPSDAPTSNDRWVENLAAVAKARRKAVPKAISAELATVLASQAAGLEQLMVFEKRRR